MADVDELIEKDELKLQFCLCFSSYNNGGYLSSRSLSWYSFDPEEDVETSELPHFFMDSSGHPEIREGFSCALVDSKLYLIGGFDGNSNTNSRMVFCYDMRGKSWIRKSEMTLPRYNPKLVVSRSPITIISRGKKKRENLSAFYIYAVGSGLSHTHPITTLEPLLEVYDEDKDIWYSPPKPLPSSIDTRGIYDTTIVEIDSRKKIFVTLASTTVTLDLQTEEWEDVTDHFWELRKTFSGNSPVFYNNVWYVYDDNRKEVRGFDFSKQFWFTLEGLGKIDSYSSYLLNIGESMYLVSCTPNSDCVTSSVYSIKFKIKEGINGFQHANDVLKSPSRTVIGTEFLHCLPILEPFCLQPKIQIDSAAEDETKTSAQAPAGGSASAGDAAVEQAEKLALGSSLFNIILDILKFKGAAEVLSRAIFGGSSAKIDNVRFQQVEGGRRSVEMDNMRDQQENKGKKLANIMIMKDQPRKKERSTAKMDNMRAPLGEKGQNIMKEIKPDSKWRQSNMVDGEWRQRLIFDPIK